MIDQQRLDEGLAEVRALVEADGGGLTVVAEDLAAGSIDLRLILEGAECEECVMPRPFLEQVALDVIQRSVPEIRKVTIDDPREHE